MDKRDNLEDLYKLPPPGGARWRKQAHAFFKDHVKASRELDDFRRTQHLNHLRVAASTMEEFHLSLQKNQDFWAQLRKLPDNLQTEDQRAKVEALGLPRLHGQFAFRPQHLLSV